MAYAIVTTVNPKANATPSRPIPTLGNAAARTALPQPPRTNQNVPKNSALYFFIAAPLTCYLLVTGAPIKSRRP
jgi:hypothetical protein